MNEHRKEASNELSDLGPGHERKQRRKMQKFVRDTADYTTKKCLKKFTKHFEKRMRDVEKRLVSLEKGHTCPLDPDQDEDGFFQLRRR